MNTRHISLLLTALPLTVALGACASRNTALPANVTSALETAFTQGNVQACADLYTDDAEIFSEHSPVVQGKHAIAAFFKDQVAREIAFDTDSTVSVVEGTLAVDQGTYRVRNVRLGRDVEYGEYMNAWRLSGGRWQVFRSMYNTTMSPSVGVSVSPEEIQAASTQ